MKFFGFEFRKAIPEVSPEETLQTFSAPQEDDGALLVAAGGIYGRYVDVTGTAKSEADLINKYRAMEIDPIVSNAIEEVVNDAIVDEGDEPIVKLDLERLVDLSQPIKQKINAEFDLILELLDFNTKGYEVFKRWYVDGRIYYHAIIDVTKPHIGIQELRYVDPRKIRKVREVQKKKTNPQSQVITQQVVDEYFVYNEAGFSTSKSNQSIPGNPQDASGIRITKDSIVHVTSGLTDETGTIVYSYLHKALRVANQLRMLEDATVIYRLVRAPERRIFYLDVGSLPKAKAEQYMYEMMTKYKNKIVYDQTNGEIKDERKFMTMLEDYWLPRREGGRGTEITTLEGGQNLGEMSDVEYFQKKLYDALGIPKGRISEDAMFSFGKPAETTREEVKFSRFITRLRSRFNDLFLQALGKQLVLKKVLTQEEWESYSSLIKFNYAQDSFFAELKELEIINNRLAAVQACENIAGKYVSHRWVRKKILRQTEEDIAEQDEEMQEELADPRYQPEGSEQIGNDQGGGEGDDDDQTQQILQGIAEFVASNGYDRTSVSKYVRETFGVSYTDAYYYVDLYKQGQQ